MSNTMPQNCEPCPACNGTGNASGHYQVDDGSQGMPKFCPVCRGRGYVTGKTAKIVRRRTQYVQLIGAQLADEHPEHNRALSDGFIAYASLIITNLLLNGFERGDALLMGFVAAMIDFGYAKEVDL